MPINLNDLPPRYRTQVLAKALHKASSSKYHNKKCEYGGITFDSKKEKQRYLFLLDMLNMGVIKDLRLQHTFMLQEPYTTPTGERIRSITYKADFTYWADGEFYVEDVKSEITKRKPEYRMKVKMMKDKLGVKVDEIEDVGVFFQGGKQNAFKMR